MIAGAHPDPDPDHDYIRAARLQPGERYGLSAIPARGAPDSDDFVVCGDGTAPTAAARWIRAHGAHQIYLQPNPSGPATGRAGRQLAADVLVARMLLVDLDPHKTPDDPRGLDAAKREACDRAARVLQSELGAACGVRPALIDSGRGRQLWLLAAGLTQDERVLILAAARERVAQMDLAHLCGVDSTADAARLMRLPGWHEHKSTGREPSVIDPGCGGDPHPRAALRLTGWARDLVPLPELAPLACPDERWAGVAGRGASGQGTGADRLRDLLGYISPEDYAMWGPTVGAALHHWGQTDGDDGTARALWDAWSAGSPKFDPRLQEAKWRSWRASGSSTGKAVTVGSIYYHARLGGWRPPRSAHRRPAPAPLPPPGAPLVAASEARPVPIDEVARLLPRRRVYPRDMVPIRAALTDAADAGDEAAQLALRVASHRCGCGQIGRTVVNLVGGAQREGGYARCHERTCGICWPRRLLHHRDAILATVPADNVALVYTIRGRPGDTMADLDQLVRDCRRIARGIEGAGKDAALAGGYYRAPSADGQAWVYLAVMRNMPGQLAMSHYGRRIARVIPWREDRVEARLVRGPEELAAMVGRVMSTWSSVGHALLADPARLGALLAEAKGRAAMVPLGKPEHRWLPSLSRPPRVEDPDDPTAGLEPVSYDLLHQGEIVDSRPFPFSYGDVMRTLSTWRRGAPVEQLVAEEQAWRRIEDEREALAERAAQATSPRTPIPIG